MLTVAPGFAGDVFNGDRRTWYTKAYPDGLEPTLLFMVKDEGREALVTRAIREWQDSGNRSRIHAKALTVKGAAAGILSMLGPGWGRSTGNAAGRGAPQPPQASELVTPEEFEVLRSYCVEAHGGYKRLRAEARERGEPPPDYPKGTDEVAAVVARIRERLSP